MKHPDVTEKLRDRCGYRSMNQENCGTRWGQSKGQSLGALGLRETSGFNNGTVKLGLMARPSL